MILTSAANDAGYEQQKSTHRFGVFEFNAANGELRKRSVRLKLQQQPRQILGILLERPGEVVTREELQHALWPGDLIKIGVSGFSGSLGATASKTRAL